jgi:hypothetical protein
MIDTSRMFSSWGAWKHLFASPLGPEAAASVQVDADEGGLRAQQALLFGGLMATTTLPWACL